MVEVSKNRTGTADYRMTGAVGAETTQNNTGELKILKSRGNQSKVFAIVICLASIMMFSGCGSGSGGSKLKKNEYLGSLPSICANYEAKRVAFEEKWEKKAEKVSDRKKAMKMIAEYDKEEKAMKEKFDADYKSELEKIVGKEIPVTFSKELQSSGDVFYNVAPVKLVNEEGRLAVAISLSAKNNFDVPRMKGYDFEVGKTRIVTFVPIGGVPEDAKSIDVKFAIGIRTYEVEGRRIPIEWK